MKYIRFLFLAALFFSILSGFAYLTVQVNRPRLIPATGSAAQAYFSPEDDLRSLLIDLIRQETKSLRIAMYTLTEKAISMALIAAHKKGILVECVVDRGYSTDRFSRIAD